MKPLASSSRRGFSMMQAVVVAAVLVVLGAIAVPVFKTTRAKAHRSVALERMRELGKALTAYTAQNNGALPTEDAPGTDTWEMLAKPAARDAWYNALPRLIGRKAAADFASAPEAFYSDENALFLPGANYPDVKKFAQPQFAIAWNTKLQRRDINGRKERTQLDQITHPARTVALLEQGCLNESRTLDVQTKKDYDGAPKGSAKSFVGRYGGQGVLGFLDGHAELASVRDTLTETGDFPQPQRDIIWTRTPEEDANKDESLAANAPKVAPASNR